MPNRDRNADLLAVAAIVGGTAVLVGVFVFPILLGWPVGFGLPTGGAPPVPKSAPIICHRVAAARTSFGSTCTTAAIILAFDRTERRAVDEE